MKFLKIEKNILHSNPHPWIIAIIVIGLAIFYYYIKANLANINYPWFRDFIYYEYEYKINGSLFIIPFIYATLKFWWRGALVTLLISESIMLPYVLYMASNPESFGRNLFYSMAPILVIGFITLELKLREKDKKIVSEREAERRSYMSQVFKAQEDERHRIAQELHDDTLQMLYVIANRTQELVSKDNIWSINQVETKAEIIRSSILKVAEDVRRLSLDLRPSILDDLSIVPALRWLIDRINQNDGPKIQLNVEGVERKISREADIVIFRIVQEALNNARKHANATMIQVSLKFATDTCKITIEDNGTGFLLPQKISNFVTAGKLGVIGMKQRAEFLGGTFDINSELGKGTSLGIEIRA